MKTFADRFAPLFTAVSLAVLMSLTACGGGGGGGGDEDPPSGVTLQGVAAKGLLSKAIVKAYQVGSDGIGKTLLKQGFTDTTGGYQLTGLPVGVVILIEVSAGAETTMIDEATDQEEPVPAGFLMRAAQVLTVASAGGVNTLQVTPFSEMAVAKAQLVSGKLDTVSVGQANADISRYFPGVDILRDPPVFGNGGRAPLNQAAVVLAAVAELAKDGAVPGCATGDQGAKVRCVVEAMAAAGSSDEDLGALIAEAIDTVQGSTTEPYTGAPVPPPVLQPEEFLPPDTRAGVDAAKALIASIRNNLRALDGTGAGTLDQRVREIQAAFTNATSPLGDSQRALLQTIVEATSVLEEVAYFTTEGGALPPFHVDVMPQVRDALYAGCSFYSDAAFDVLATSYDDARYIGCRVVHAEVVEGGIRYLIHHNVLIAPSTAGYAVRTRVLKQAVSDQGELVGEPAVLTVYESPAASMSISRSPQGAITGLSLSGKLAPAVDTGGGVGAGPIVVDVSFQPVVTSAGATRLNVKGQFIQLGSEATVLSTLSLKEGSYVQAKLTQPGVPGSDVVDESQSAFVFAFDASVGSGETLSGTVTAGDVALDAGGKTLPRQVSFTGSIVDAAGQELFGGHLEVVFSNVASFDQTRPEASGNFLRKTVLFDGSLFVPNRSPLALNLTLNEVAAFGTYGLAGSYQQGETQVNVSGSGTRGQGGNLTFSTPSGLSLTLTEEQARADITQAGVVVGYVDRPNAIIYYADNTRESF